VYSDTTRFTQFQVAQFYTYAIKKNKKFETIIFLRSAEFFLASMKAQGDESSERMPLGDNIGIGVSSSSSVLEFIFKLDCLTYIYIYIYIYA
jgi:hypothetical protein